MVARLISSALNTAPSIIKTVFMGMIAKEQVYRARTVGAAVASSQSRLHADLSRLTRLTRKNAALAAPVAFTAAPMRAFLRRPTGGGPVAAAVSMLYRCHFPQAMLKIAF